MSYAGAEFWIFLGLVVLGFAALPAPKRAAWLILASLWFYAAADPLRLIWLAGIVGATLAGLGAGVWLRRIAIAGLLALLVWAKFADALGLPDPSAPPGLSFVVFTAVAVLAEAMRRGERWPWSGVVLHLIWFPKLLAGPIERPQDLIAQLGGLALRPGSVRLGLAFILTGLAKKLILADGLAATVDQTFAMADHAAPVDLLIACYFFAFQIYGDFSGYADLAVGLSALVGLRLSANFDRPYLAVTVSEFWAQRWHITLGRWFRDFVYIPLGGNRHGAARQMLNLMTVFLLSGLWHSGLGYGLGWGFVLWGALNGSLVAVETWLPTPRRAASRLARGLLTFHLILLGWVVFRAATPGQAVTILSRLWASRAALPGLIQNHPFTADHKTGAILIAALMLAEVATGTRPIAERLAGAPILLRWVGIYALLAALLLNGRWQQTEFIYAGF